MTAAEIRNKAPLILACAILLLLLAIAAAWTVDIGIGMFCEEEGHEGLFLESGDLHAGNEQGMHGMFKEGGNEE